MELAKLDREISQIAEAERFSGVIRVTLKDNILYERCIGDADHEKKLPFTPESMFTLYSLSKPFCAIGLLLLADKGLVDLDVHPGVYLKEAKHFDSRVTIRHMLNHTSGIPDFLRIDTFKNTPGTPEKIRELLPVLAEHPTAFAPGTQDLYANINFTLSALIIENITGMPYADYMKQEVFEPMGAKTLVVDSKSRVIPHRVQGYSLIDNVITPIEKCHDWMLGAGDLVGRVEDVYCLNLAIKHRLLLKPETWEQVLTPSSINNRGLGCTVHHNWHGKHRITHNGGHRGFRTFHVQFPQDDLDVIILSNHGFGGARQAIVESVYRAFYQDEAAPETELVLDYNLR